MSKSNIDPILSTNAKRGEGFQGCKLEAWTVKKPNGQTALDLVCVSIDECHHCVHNFKT